jgi:hypothetical protein
MAPPLPARLESLLDEAHEGQPLALDSQARLVLEHLQERLSRLLAAEGPDLPTHDEAPSGLGLETLTEGVLSQVLGFLDVSDLLRAITSCKACLEVGRSEVRWTAAGVGHAAARLMSGEVFGGDDDLVRPVYCCCRYCAQAYCLVARGYRR